MGYDLSVVRLRGKWSRPGGVRVVAACSFLVVAVVMACGSSAGNPPSTEAPEDDAGRSDARASDSEGTVADVHVKDASVEARLCGDASQPGSCPGVNADTDNNNCGGCGIVCSAVAPSVAQCTAGRCLVTLAAGVNGPFHIALDGTHVYWGGFGGSGPSVIAKMPLGGGTVTNLVSGDQHDDSGEIQQPLDIAIDSTSVYWTNVAGPITTGSVRKIGLDGGAVTTLVSGPGTVNRIVVDSSNVYWGTPSSLTSMPLDGGTLVTRESGKGVGGIAVDTASIYWLPPIKKAPLSGGSPTILAAAGRAMIDLTVDATSVYWTDGSSGGQGGSVRKVPLDGGATTILATGGQPTMLTVDCQSVYWTDSSNGTVMKVPLDGGAATLLATGISPWGIRVDATSVYWADYNGGVVMKLTPK